MASTQIVIANVPGLKEAYSGLENKKDAVSVVVPLIREHLTSTFPSDHELYPTVAQFIELFVADEVVGVFPYESSETEGGTFIIKLVYGYAALCLAYYAKLVCRVRRPTGEGFWMADLPSVKKAAVDLRKASSKKVVPPAVPPGAQPATPDDEEVRMQAAVVAAEAVAAVSTTEGTPASSVATAAAPASAAVVVAGIEVDPTVSPAI